MSYILDALKKAESERHLGELPGLHTPSLAALAPVTRPVWWQSRSIGLTVLVIALASVAAFAWQWVRSGEVGMRSPLTIAPASTESLPIALTVPVTPSVSTTAPGLASDLPVPPPLPKVPPISKAMTAAQPPHGPSAALAAIATNPVSPLAPAKPLSAGVAPAVADPTRVLTTAQLPDALQHELPPLAIGGSMYSDSPADRMLLIDKRLFHEGDEVAPGLVLESLMPKSAILRFKGYRFRIGF